jgi:hypothetical protein
MTGKIKFNALVRQDSGIFWWPYNTPDIIDSETIFKMEKLPNGDLHCTAPGFGNEDDYGDGPVFAYADDVIFD